jgi:hypothetical protein
MRYPDTALVNQIAVLPLTPKPKTSTAEADYRPQTNVFLLLNFLRALAH